MKTAMQQHIEDLEKARSAVMDAVGNGDLAETIWGCIENAKTFLKKEKEQIFDAFVAGDERGTGEVPFNCEQYYSQKYTTT